MEPVIVAADTALVNGSAEELIRLITDPVVKGIQERYSRTIELYKHKDENVEAGRRYVAAYVEYTHYVERLQQDAEGHAAHHNEPAENGSVRSHAH